MKRTTITEKLPFRPVSPRAIADAIGRNRALALALSGGLLAGAGLPQTASAHDPDAAAVFITGAAVGYLLTEALDDDDHDHHHYRRAYYEPAYVTAPRVVYYAPPPRVVHYEVIEAPPRYYGPRRGNGHWDRGRHHRH
jgi:hypothetical protein